MIHHHFGAQTDLVESTCVCVCVAMSVCVKSKAIWFKLKYDKQFVRIHNWKWPSTIRVSLHFVYVLGKPQSVCVVKLDFFCPKKKKNKQTLFPVCFSVAVASNRVYRPNNEHLLWRFVLNNRIRIPACLKPKTEHSRSEFGCKSKAGSSQVTR